MKAKIFALAVVICDASAATISIFHMGVLTSASPAGAPEVRYPDIYPM
jgi:hypothetical protein